MGLKLAFPPPLSLAPPCSRYNPRKLPPPPLPEVSSGICWKGEMWCSGRMKKRDIGDPLTKPQSKQHAPKVISVEFGLAVPFVGVGDVIRGVQALATGTGQVHLQLLGRSWSWQDELTARHWGTPSSRQKCMTTTTGTDPDKEGWRPSTASPSPAPLSGAMQAPPSSP